MPRAADEFANPTGKFEAIQDSWPEEIVSVEAVAVEPYPDLE